MDKSSTTSYEQGLWKSFLEGDEKSLSLIYTLYFDHLYNYGFKFTRDATMVEDCIQELFIKLIRNKQNLSLPDSVKGYLFTALRSYMFDKMEQARKNLYSPINESQEFGIELHREATLILNEETAASQQKLQKLLAQLTPRQREAIFLKYQEGLSYPEIAAMLSLTQKATYKLIGRAIQTLRSASLSTFVAVLTHLICCLI